MSRRLDGCTTDNENEDEDGVTCSNVSIRTHKHLCAICLAASFFFFAYFFGVILSGLYLDISLFCIVLTECLWLLGSCCSWIKLHLMCHIFKRLPWIPVCVVLCTCSIFFFFWDIRIAWEGSSLRCIEGKGKFLCIPCESRSRNNPTQTAFFYLPVVAGDISDGFVFPLGALVLCLDWETRVQGVLLLLRLNNSKSFSSFTTECSDSPQT